MAEDDVSEALDQDLVARVQRGDSAAFDLLVRKYQHRVGALISRYIHDWAEVQDVAQDTFIRAYRAIGVGMFAVHACERFGVSSWSSSGFMRASMASRARKIRERTVPIGQSMRSAISS